MDAATPEFPQDLHNTRSRVLSPPYRNISNSENSEILVLEDLKLLFEALGYIYLRCAESENSGSANASCSFYGYFLVVHPDEFIHPSIY